MRASIRKFKRKKVSLSLPLAFKYNKRIFHYAYYLTFDHLNFKTSSILGKINLREHENAKNVRFSLTSAHEAECCLGERKKVPSTSGYLSKTSIAERHSTQETRDHCNAANVDKIKQRVSSLP